MAMPGYLQEVKDPTYDGSITRITNNAGWRNTYARIGAWNADGSRIHLIGYGNRLLNGRTYEDLGSVPHLGNPTWSNTNPNVIWNTSNGDNRLKRYDITSGTNSTFHTFGGYTGIDLGPSETTISDNDRYIALIGYLSSGGREVFLFDTQSKAVLFKAGLPAEPDWAGVSPTGRYVVVSYGPDGSGTAQGYKIYDRDAANPSQPRHLANKTSHSDFARLADGAELLIHLNNGVSAVRLANGQSWVILSNSAFPNGHVSGKAIDRWGWVYLSNHVYGSMGTPGHDQIVAVKTDGSETVQVFAHARTVQPTGSFVYERSTFAVPNRDGTKVIWGGRWNGGGNVYSYVVRVK
jgi:hypothetical protein